MDMGVDQSRHHGPAASVDYHGVVRNDRVVFPAYLRNTTVLEDDDRVVDRLGFVTVEQHSADDRDRHVGPEVLLACNGRACKDDGEQ